MAASLPYHLASVVEVAMVVVAGLGIVFVLVGVAVCVLGLGEFVAFVDEDRTRSRPTDESRRSLQVGAVTFIVGLVATYLLARVDGTWAVAGAPVLLAGSGLLARGERTRHSTALKG
jgi:hypothetical protein